MKSISLIENISSKELKIEHIPPSELQKKERLLKVKVSLPCDFFKITDEIERRDDEI